MLPFINKKTRSVIGVDIGSSSVKLLELAGGPAQYKVLSFAEEPLPISAVIEKEIKDINAVSEAIHKAYKRAKPSCQAAATAVSGSAVITKIIQLPSNLSEDEVESQIELEAEQHLPFALDEVSIDFEILGMNADDSQVYDILLAACRTENVDVRIDSLDLAGLHAKVVDIEIYALERALKLILNEEDAASGTVALVDLGAQISTFNVMQEGNIIYTRDQVFGGQPLMDNTLRQYEMSYEEALVMRVENNYPSDYIEEVLMPFRQSLIEQIENAYTFFLSSSQYDNVDLFIISGGCAMIDDLADMLEKQIGVPTKIANPFKNMTVARKINQKALEKHAPSLLLSCGLALRSFD